jgi:uncharacterized membrane protein YqaE (UPF0057 family)
VIKKTLILTLVLFTFTILVSNNSAAALVAPLYSTPAAPTSEPSPTAVKSALDEFRSLSRKERKARIKNAKKEFRKYKAERKSGVNTDIEPWVLIVLAILLPPLAVYLYEDEINWKFWVSILLTLLFWIPGIVFAFLVIFGQV